MQSLSKRHRAVLAVRLADLLKRLADLEQALSESERGGPLCEHVPDLSAAEQQALARGLETLRATILDCAARHAIPLQVRRISLRHTVLAGLKLMRVAVDELSPRSLKAYGSIGPAGKRELTDIESSIGSAVDELIRLLQHGPQS